MACNQGTKYSGWEKWGGAAFFVYCLSTVFMIFFSTTAVQIWPYPWSRLSILVGCLLPLWLVVIWRIPDLIHGKRPGKQFLFIPVIVVLGILNIIFSEDRPTTLKVMVLFLVSGIGVFGVTSCVLNTRFRQKIFLWLYWACLLGTCAYGTLEYLNGKSILLLSYNPIPAGALLILLFSGPLLLFPCSSRLLRLLEVLSVLFGIAIIVLIGKRGAIMGMVGMAFLLGALLPGRKSRIIPVIALLLIGTGYQFRDRLPSTLRVNPATRESTMIRLENYAFAVHIFKEKALFGVGLRAPLEKYVSGYQQKTVTHQNYPFSLHIESLGTVENIILCVFVEMGGLFAITYIGLLTYLLAKLFYSVRRKAENRLRAVLFLTPLFGFFVHSMTFDSLMYPHLNWLFHSLLGLMANFNET